MKPIRTEPDGTPVFTVTQIDDYGFPEHYGFLNYLVIETSNDIPYVTDYDMEHQYDLRQIHRYSRIARFKSTLYQLMGDRQVPPHVIAMVKTYIDPTNPDRWNATRKILKHYKQSAYYNRIPYILAALGYEQPIPKLSPKLLQQTIDTYSRIADKFERIKHLYKIRYFPNMRYMVCKILQVHGITVNIPFIRTERKRRSLEALWLNLQ